MAEKTIKLNMSRRYRTNPDFILRKISGEAVLVPTGDSVFGNSMISVNETFTYLWETQILSFIAECVHYGMILEEEE